MIELVTTNSMLEIEVDAKDGSILNEDIQIDNVTFSYTGIGLDNKEHTINDKKLKSEYYVLLFMVKKVLIKIYLMNFVKMVLFVFVLMVKLMI